MEFTSDRDDVLVREQSDLFSVRDLFIINFNRGGGGNPVEEEVTIGIDELFRDRLATGPDGVHL